MNLRELEEFQLAVELAKHRQVQAAYFIFSRLRQTYPYDSRLLAYCAFTTTDPDEARNTLDIASKLDSSNPLLARAGFWLEGHLKNDPWCLASFIDADQALARGETTLPTYKEPVAEEAEIKEPVAEEAEIKEPVADKAEIREAALPITPTGITRPGPVKKSKAFRSEKDKARPGVVAFSGLWWFRLGCSLALFGAIMTLLYLFTNANNLNDSEKAYFTQVSQLNQKTREINAQLQAAVDQFNANKLEKSELEKHFRHIIGLDEEFRLLKSPSARFDRLDGLLGQAYSYFNQGSVNIINGLESNDAGLVSEGNRLFELGNNILRQAREELKALGG
jgi:hypothetical protein